MPRTSIPLATIPADDSGLRLDAVSAVAGAVVVAGDAANGNAYPLGPRSRLSALNSGVSSRNLTFTATVDGLTLQRTVALAAGEHRVFALDPSIWGLHGAADVGTAYVDAAHADVLLCAFIG